ncbi:MAG: Sec-independent protein translocase protein TatB [Paracoccaceae bacterium]
MFDLGMTELLVVGVVALIVVGPKDLPKLFREVGRFTGKARGMAREFSRAMNDAADESGVRDIDRSLRAASQPMKAGGDALKGLADRTLGPATQALSEERAANRAKIDAAMATAARNRQAREAAEAEDAAIAAEADEPMDAAPAAPVPDPNAPTAPKAPEDNPA